jgi:2'-5' RNA ligase
MVPGRNRYFIALIPPVPVRDEIHEFKLRMRDEFGSKAALQSPPHLTLHMPFEWKSEKEDYLIQSITGLAKALAPVTIQFAGFGSFPPRVIFVHVIPSSELLALQKSIRQHCRRALGLLHSDYQDLPFHPHITIGFRDLKKEAFSLAWVEFQSKPWDVSFRATSLCLLRHNEKKWEEFVTVPLAT